MRIFFILLILSHFLSTIVMARPVPKINNNEKWIIKSIKNGLITLFIDLMVPFWTTFIEFIVIDKW